MQKSRDPNKQRWPWSKKRILKSVQVSFHSYILHRPIVSLQRQPKLFESRVTLEYHEHCRKEYETTELFASTESDDNPELEGYQWLGEEEKKS